MNKLASVLEMRRTLGLVAVMAGALLSGCATQPPTAAAMVPAPQVVGKQHPAKLAVSASSLLDAAPAASAKPGVKTGGALIEEAIVASVQQSKVFSQVVSRGDAQYVLTATLIANETPPWGGTFTARCEMGWVLTKADGSTVWKEVVKSEGTATGSDAFVGVQRAQMARERAVRENISLAIARLGKLEL
jgi:hypothetical protein